MPSVNEHFEPYNFSSEFSFAWESDRSERRDDEFAGEFEDGFDDVFEGVAVNLSLASNGSRVASVYDFNEVRLKSALIESVVFVPSVHCHFCLNIIKMYSQDKNSSIQMKLI